MAAAWTQEWFVAVALGQVPGHSRVVALGSNPDVDTGGHEDTWPIGGIYPWQSSAVAHEVVSTSANDTAGGTGAQSVVIDQLDDNYAVISSQTVATNGTTPVPVPINGKRTNGFRVGAAGSGGTNDGDITLRVVAGAVPQSRIPAGVGISRQAVYTVRAGHTLFVTSLVTGINRNTGVGRFASWATMFRTSAGVTRLPLELPISDGPPYRHEGFMPIPVAEKTDFTMRWTSVSTDNTDLTAGFEAVLKDNTVN